MCHSKYSECVITSLSSLSFLPNYVLISPDININSISQPTTYLVGGCTYWKPTDEHIFSIRPEVTTCQILLAKVSTRNPSLESDGNWARNRFRSEANFTKRFLQLQQFHSRYAYASLWTSRKLRFFMILIIGGEYIDSMTETVMMLLGTYTIGV